MNNEEEILSILESMQSRMDVTQVSLESVKTELQAVKTDVQTVKTEVSSIKLTLENETNRNIEIIAEGHLDIIRKLDDALKVENEKELILVRMNRMENEIRLLKEQVQRLA